LLEGSGGGTLEGVDAALDGIEAIFDNKVCAGEAVFAVEDFVGVGGVRVVEGVVGVELPRPNIGFDGAETTDPPFVVNDGIDEVALAGGDGVKLGVVFGSELGEGGGIFTANDLRVGVNAGFQGIQAGDLFAGFGARPGRFLGVAPVGFKLRAAKSN